MPKHNFFPLFIRWHDAHIIYFKKLNLKFYIIYRSYFLKQYVESIFEKTSHNIYYMWLSMIDIEIKKKMQPSAQNSC